jgi:hypothetical protein
MFFTGYHQVSELPRFKQALTSIRWRWPPRACSPAYPCCLTGSALWRLSSSR